MNDSEDDAAPSRRETPNSVLVGRQARLLVTPVQEKIGAWQAETVKLEVMAQRLRASGRSDPSVAEAARALLGLVGMQAQLFEGSVAEAPPAVQAHSRVTDARKVLVRLAARLETLLRDLGEPSDKAR